MTAVAESKPPLPKAAPNTITFASPGHLARAIHNALLCAGTDMTLPMIAAVRFEWDGKQIHTVGTDRYRLSLDTIDVDPQVDHGDIEPFDFLLTRADAKAALAFVKGVKYSKLTIAYAEPRFPDGGKALFQTDSGSSVSYPVLDATFPPYRSLIPEHAAAKPTDTIAFNPAFLADLAKIQTGDGTRQRVAPPITIRTFHRPDESPKPVRIDYADGPVVILMPIWLPS